MSAFIVNRSSESVVILTDGAACDPANGYVLSSLESKIWPMPHISAVMLWVGSTNIPRLLILYRQKQWTSFDRMLEVLPENLREAAATARERFPDSNATAGVVVAGWSDKRQRFETYSIETHHDEDPSTTPELTELPKLSRCPAFDDAAVLVAQDKAGNGIECLHELMEMQRREKQVPASTKDQEAIYTVGGFIQQTVLTKDKIETSIVKRWNDVIGMRLDPEQSEQ